MSFAQRLVVANGFNTQPPEGGCTIDKDGVIHGEGFNTQPPEGGCQGVATQQHTLGGFNTQPPEGGCRLRHYCFERKNGFQHTAARRRLLDFVHWLEVWQLFQHTAARRRLPSLVLKQLPFWIVSTHSRPKAAAVIYYVLWLTYKVSTHSRPKAAASGLRSY